MLRLSAVYTLLDASTCVENHFDKVAEALDEFAAAANVTTDTFVVGKKIVTYVVVKGDLT